nr:ATP phosphoribosyltransferase regulatory subunit [Micromonospora sp. DSM 115978]
VNNRKVLQGFYEGLGVSDPLAVIRAADKLDKIGEAGVEQVLTSQVGLSTEQAKAVLALAGIRATGSEVVAAVSGLGVKSDLLSEGLDELTFVLDELADLPPGSIVADLSIARGLDYYTGTVYEAKVASWPGFGSICSGGRYDDLAGSYIRRNLPGVGISIGFTRIFAKMLAEGLLEVGGSSPAQVLVAVPSEARRRDAAATARGIRRRGFDVETYHQADKVGRQIRYASRKKIAYIWFPPFDDGRSHEVKNLATGEQIEADPETWSPPASA